MLLAERLVHRPCVGGMRGSLGEEEMVGLQSRSWKDGHGEEAGAVFFPGTQTRT